MTKDTRIRLVLVIALPALAAAGAFLACGDGLDPERSAEACEGGPCEPGASDEGTSSVDGRSSVDATVTTKDGSVPASDGGRDAADGGGDAADGGGDAADGGRDAADTGPAPALLVPCDDGGLPGMLDPTFGDGGVVYVNADPTANSYAIDGVVQPDGKTVLAGNITSPTGRRFALTRLTAAGGLDTGFGDGGIVSTAFPAGKGGYATAVTLTADGRILAGGNVYRDATANDFAVARYSPGGALDATFGDGGVAFAGFGAPNWGTVKAIAVDPDGRVLVAGQRGSNLDPPADSVIARLNANGSLDTTFGSGGRVTVDVRSTDDGVGAMVLQSDGKIVLVGSSDRPTTILSDLSAIRLNADGSLDPSFGVAGKAVHAIGTKISSGANAVALDGAGRLSLGGGTTSTTRDFAVFRLTSTGALDSTFGSGGVASTDFGGNYDSITGTFIQPDGKIVQVGRSSNDTPPFALGFARYQPNGSPDLGFGIGGKTLSVKPGTFEDYAAAFTAGRVTLVGLGRPGGVPELWMGAARFCL